MEIIKVLETRFYENKAHKNMEFNEVLPFLNKIDLNKVIWMEETGGSPEIIKYNNKYIIIELSQETPNRRSVCYDYDARVNRNKFPPKTSALEISAAMGLEVVDEELYLYIQTLKNIDTKTSSWLKTPDDLRALGGAITGEYRYNRVFIYHNGAGSYYQSRSFRTYLCLNY